MHDAVLASQSALPGFVVRFEVWGLGCSGFRGLGLGFRVVRFEVWGLVCSGFRQ